MPTIHHTARARAPLALAFGHVDDYRTVPEWLFGVSQFEPAGDLDHGLGAVFDAAMKLGPVTIRTTVEVTAWEQDALIRLKSIKGFRNESTWRFTSLGPDETEINVDFSYDLPGGLAGRALGASIEPFIAATVKHSERSLREAVERRHAQGAEG